MGLLRRLFGGDALATGPGDAPPLDGDTTLEPDGTDNDRRRDLVQMVLRDTMRAHAVPSDWIECRILSIAGGQQVTGMHVQFIIRQGEAQLIEYVHPFQDTFWKEIEKFESRPRDWLLSLSWQFDGEGGAAPGPLATAAGWNVDTQVPEQDTQPPDEQADQLALDLEALFAIRDAALADTGDPPAHLPPMGTKPPR